MLFIGSIFTGTVDQGNDIFRRDTFLNGTSDQDLGHAGFDSSCFVAKEVFADVAE